MFVQICVLCGLGKFCLGFGGVKQFCLCWRNGVDFQFGEYMQGVQLIIDDCMIVDLVVYCQIGSQQWWYFCYGCVWVGFVQLQCMGKMEDFGCFDVWQLVFWCQMVFVQYGEGVGIFFGIGVYEVGIVEQYLYGFIIDMVGQCFLCQLQDVGIVLFGMDVEVVDFDYFVVEFVQVGQVVIVC